MFEISDICVLDNNTDTMARNERKICALYMNTNSGFEIIQGLLDLIMIKIGGEFGKDYRLAPTDDIKMYFTKRGAQVLFKGKSIGSIGVLHPEVLDHFKLKYPVTCFEIDLESLYDHFKSSQN